MSSEEKFTLWVRKLVEVNTDPQRRCYDGCHARSELQWTAWGEVYSLSSKESLEDSCRVFKEINPSREYIVLPAGEHPEAGLED